MAKDPPRGNRKRPFGATVRSLHDITNNSASGPGLGDNDASSSSGTGGAGGGKIAVAHIPSLPQHEEAAAILKRIHSEFRVLIERRGWTVTSITEMCCCGDGIDCLKKRKTKTMPDNVLGYNRSSYGRGKTVHDIHLRLRHPRTHELVDYESIAATMCHELAHCVRGPHDAKFYKAMEEIEEQYAVFLAKGVVVDKDGFPIGSTEAHVLGKGGGSANGSGSNNAPIDRRRALEAAEKRRKRNQNGLTQGHVLGGRQSLGKKDPREAARIAAERRLLDSQYCLPCNEIIEILGEDSDDEVMVDDDSEVEVVENSSAGGKTAGLDASGDELDRKPRAKSDTTTTSSDGVIDLTSDDSFETSSASLIGDPKPAAQPKRNMKTAHAADGNADWTCPRCTLCNSSVILACDACNLERPCSKTILEQAMEIKRNDDISDVKKREVQQSKEEFGGFNIYGSEKDPSLTMKHLT